MHAINETFNISHLENNVDYSVAIAERWLIWQDSMKVAKYSKLLVKEYYNI